MHYSVISGWFGDHMLMPPGKFFTMFHFLEYPFSRGSTHIKSPDPYASPDFDTGFMNDERDMVPMVWGYIKSRETARRMDAYAGEVEAMVCTMILCFPVVPGTFIQLTQTASLLLL